jgi:hypothetical protein
MGGYQESDLDEEVRAEVTARTVSLMAMAIVLLVGVCIYLTIPKDPDKNLWPSGKIVVNVGDTGIVDRGTDLGTRGTLEHVGPWIFAEESFGKTVYLYHDSGQLRARIVNPTSVVSGG